MGYDGISFGGVTYTSDTTISVVKNQQYSIIAFSGSGLFQNWEGTNVNLPVPNSSNTIVTITGDTATLKAVFPEMTPTPTPTVVPSTATPTPTPTESPLDFEISGTCDGDGAVSTHHYTGGSGFYDRGNGLYDTELEALNETQWATILNPNGYVGYGLPISNITKTYWVAARDRNNISNIIAKSILVDCAPTATPTPTPTLTSTPTPTPTATEVPPTETPTPTPTSVGGGIGEWYFYSDEGTLNAQPPVADGNAIFRIQGSPVVETFNPNKSNGVNEIYFNLDDSNGTNYTTQFTELATNGGTISITQGANTVTYTSTTPGAFFVESGGGFFLIQTGPSTQTVTSANPFVFGDPISITFGS
jgi:hypothetical protein